MRYRATNGITTAVLTEAEAREHYERAQYVTGVFGETFVTCPVGEYGRLLSVATTTYIPINDDPSVDASQGQGVGAAQGAGVSAAQGVGVGAAQGSGSESGAGPSSGSGSGP
jgi:hypothetical protein